MKFQALCALIATVESIKVEENSESKIAIASMVLAG